MPISYLGQYNDNQRIITRVEAISQQLPSLATGNQQAMLIGGVATQANNIYADSQALRTEIPRLATGNQLTATQGSISSGRNEQSTRFNAVDAQLLSISGQVSSISAGIGSSALISINGSEFIVPLVVNLAWLDLAYLLGCTETGFSNPGGAVVNVVANSTEFGEANVLLGRDSQAWHSTNASNRNLTIDFGFNKSTRTARLTGLGFQSFFGGGLGNPVTLAISGSNNNSSYTTINTWSNPGFNADSQWKYTTFSNNAAYRYIRISQQGLNSIGNNYFSCHDLRFYGSIQNP